MAATKIKDPKPISPKIPNNPKKEAITFTEIAIFNVESTYLRKQEITENGIMYVQDALSKGTINSGDTPISGFNIQTTLSGKLDLNTYFGSFHGEWIIANQNETFEGTITGKVEAAIISGKFIGNGKGDFKDQKIKGTFKGSINNLQVEIVLQGTIISKIE